MRAWQVPILRRTAPKTVAAHVNACFYALPGSSSITVHNRRLSSNCQTIYQLTIQRSREPTATSHP